LVFYSPFVKIGKLVFYSPYSPFVCRNSIFGEFFLNMTTRKVQKANFYMSDTSMEMQNATLATITSQCFGYVRSVDKTSVGIFIL